MNGETLKSIGYTEGAAIGVALSIAKNLLETKTEKEIQAELAEVLSKTEAFKEDKTYGELANLLLKTDELDKATIHLSEEGIAFPIFGQEFIEQGAIEQMNVASKLPIAVAGALMPDSHHGYGLPIGGVLATKNAIIPYGVGVDIGCRMALTVYDISEDFFNENQAKFKRELIAHTQFGAGGGFRGKYKSEHAVLDSEVFKTNSFISALIDKASTQLGSSGGGNHFVEWGIMEFEQDDVILGVNKGKYLTLLSHSGSRGMGAMIAGHYTKIAKQVCKLPREAQNLAYFDLNSAEGQEYWIAMNLAGDYASACHEVIHEKMTKAIGGEVLCRVENHHNFAWKEVWNNEEVIVHRKGATPAGKGVMGIIPGSMTAPGFLVRGKGHEASINSASHGAGRQMSRSQAFKSVSRDEMKQELKAKGVTLIGANLDEAPMAYKNIEHVMAQQSDLVDIVAKFQPKIVRMAEDGFRED